MNELLAYAILAVNVVAFAAFGLDKHRARRGGSRIPESTLLGLSWATGLLGGWAGMSVFRHKTRKTGFRIKMVLVSIANVLWLVLWSWLR